MQEVIINRKVHRLVPSRFPPISLFDWANTPQELHEVALLEGLTNQRLQQECGDLNLVTEQDWIGGPGSTPLMAAFTHPGYSRFSDGTYGVYYAALKLETAIAETKYHRERFLRASQEAPTLIQMREYIAKIQKPLIDMSDSQYNTYLQPDPNSYPISQAFARELKQTNAYGMYYPSVRDQEGNCVAIFRPPALTIPIQGRHLDYIWDGKTITEVRVSRVLAAV